MRRDSKLLNTLAATIVAGAIAPPLSEKKPNTHKIREKEICSHLSDITPKYTAVKLKIAIQ